MKVALRDATKGSRRGEGKKRVVNLGKGKRVQEMRAEVVFKAEMEHILAALMPANRLAMEISMETGLRISDVLGLKREQLEKANDNRISVRELKTGKIKRCRLPKELLERGLAQAGKIYVFENRMDYKRPRTRQAVYKDLKRACRLMRIKEHISPHSGRKVYAVEEYHKSGDLKRVQKLLNHESEGVTMLYAMADEMTRRRIGSGKQSRKI